MCVLVKITNDKVIGLGDALTNQLVSYRKERDFNPVEYINTKVAAINEYLTKHNLDTIVVASSGGVDSAVAAALSSLATAKVKLVTVPCFDNDGVTRQEDTMHLSQELANSLGIDLTVLEITGVVDAASHVIGDGGKSPWSVGQSVPYLRTAVVYSYISRLWEMGHRAIFMGTTNFDEGGYLGQCDQCVPKSFVDLSHRPGNCFWKIHYALRCGMGRFGCGCGQCHRVYHWRYYDYGLLFAA